MPSALLAPPQIRRHAGLVTGEAAYAHSAPPMAASASIYSRSRPSMVAIPAVNSALKLKSANTGSATQWGRPTLSRAPPRTS